MSLILRVILAVILAAVTFFALASFMPAPFPALLAVLVFIAVAFFSERAVRL